MATDLRQTHYRFGIDELAESTHGWYAAEDANPSPGAIPLDTVFLLRFNEQEAGGTAAANTDAVFQYNRNGVGWIDITTTSPVVKAVAAVALANGSACTKRLSGTGTFETSGAGQTEDGSSGGPANDIAASGCSETECGLQIIGADVAHGDVLQFRFQSPDWTVTYTVTPSYTVSLPRRAQVSWAELETQEAPRRVQVSWTELETPDQPRRAQVSWAELELPDVGTDRRGQLSWAELEVPNAPRRAQVSWVELEAPDIPRRGRVSWAELETPNEPRRGLVSWVELEVPLLYTAYGMPFLFTETEWSGGVFTLEVYMRAITGTAYARLFNTSDMVAVTGSDLSTASAAFVRLRSGPLALVDAKEYRVQFARDSSGEFLGAKLVRS